RQLGRYPVQPLAPGRAVRWRSAHPIRTGQYERTSPANPHQTAQPERRPEKGKLPTPADERFSQRLPATGLVKRPLLFFRQRLVPLLADLVENAIHFAL